MKTFCKRIFWDVPLAAENAPCFPGLQCIPFDEKLEASWKDINFHFSFAPQGMDLMEHMKFEEDAMLISAYSGHLRLAKELGMAYLGVQIADPLSDCPYVALDVAALTPEYVERVYRRIHRLPWEIAETKRCILREEAPEDLDALYEIYAADSVKEWMEPLFPRAEEEAYLKDYISSMYGFYGYGMWMVIEKETGRQIGRVGFQNRQVNGETQPELGFLIAAPYQEKGYGKECCKAALAYLKDALQIPYVNCITDPQNTRAVALAKCLGFTEQGEQMIDGKPMKYFCKIL